MRKNIATVICAFSQSDSAVGDSKKTCSTNGEEIYSYNMLIARRKDERIQVIKKDRSPSRTTSMQVNAVMSSFPNAEIVDSFD